MPDKQFYRWIKVGGLLTFLPVTLVMGPLAGYFLAQYLEKKFALPHYIFWVIIALGFISSIVETVKIIKKVIALSNE